MTDDADHRPASAEAELTDRVDRETLHRLQDGFASLGKVTVCLCAVGGSPITEPTWGSRFSELLGTSPGGSKAFAERTRQCATDPSAQVPSLCHEGMTFYATPIRHGGRHLATIVVGSRAAGCPSRETVDELAARYGLDADELFAGTDQIDPYHGGTPEAIRRFADVLAQTIAMLFNQADQIHDQLADLRTVHAVAELLSGTRELSDILNLTVQRVVEVMPVKACAMRLLNEETGELVLEAVHNLSQTYQKKGPVLIRENAIDAAAFAGETVYIEDAATDPRIRYPQDARREGLVSGLCVPMTHRAKTIGVLRVYTAAKHRFSAADEALLRSIGLQAAAAIVNTRLRAEHVEAERFQRQVKAAGEIQRRMLPAAAPEHAHLQIGCVYDPTLQVGGDFYDFIKLPSGALGVCVADVVGKGLPAALMMASVRSALRAFAANQLSVDQVVSSVNRHMCRDTLIGEFATLVYGELSVDGRSFTYCNAGHEPPLLLRSGRFIALTTGGMIIGVRSEEVFQSAVVSLRPDDLLVMVTDGVVEAMDFGSTQYGRRRLRDSIRKHRELDPGHLASQLLWDVRRFVGLADQADDITVVVVKVS